MLGLGRALGKSFLKKVMPTSILEDEKELGKPGEKNVSRRAHGEVWGERELEICKGPKL